MSQQNKKQHKFVFTIHLFTNYLNNKGRGKNNLPEWIVIFLICFTRPSLRNPAMRVKFSQTYKKNNGFIWGRLFSSSSL